MKTNYDSEMQKYIDRESGEKKKLLLHSCCAPCSSAVIERLKEVFNVTVYYYNPNIDGENEFTRRANEQMRLCKLYGIPVIIEEYKNDEFYVAVKGLEREKEGGKRCEKCFYLRLKKTAERAKKDGFDFFTTTLTISPLKNAEKLNETGKLVEKETGAAFLPSDFKKHGGYLRSIELSKQFGLYRQNYCGCVFSKIERETAKSEKESSKSDFKR